MLAPRWGAAVGLLLLPACQYEVTPDIPDASGPYVGNVSLIWAPTTFGVTASFTEPQFAQVGCPGTQTGDCCIYSQPQIDISTGGTEPITVSAGAIVIEEGGALLGSFDFTGAGYVPLSSAETPSLLWSPGDTLTISAAGGLAAPFSGSVVAPPAFAGVSPDLTTTAQIVVQTARDFTVTWSATADAGGLVTLSLFDPSGFYVDCAALDDAGTVTAPAVTLSTFNAGDNGYVTLTRTASQVLQAANATVTLDAEATDPGLATFQ